MHRGKEENLCVSLCNLCAISVFSVNQHDYQRVDWGKHVRRGSPVAGCGGIPELKKLLYPTTRSIEMNTREVVKSNRRLVVWIAVGVLAFMAANSPWFTAIALACQGMGGGC